MKASEISKILLTVGAVSLIVYLMMGHRRLTNDRDSWKSIAESEKTNAEFWKNKDGSSQAEIKSIRASSEAIQVQYGEELKGLVGEVRGLKGNMKNLQTLINTSITTSGTVRAGLRDTLIVTPGQPPEAAKVFTYSDEWATMNGYFLRDTAQVKYSIRDSIDLVQTWRRPGLFKQRELFTDIISRNPNSQVKNLRSIVNRPPTKTRFVLGPFVGVAIPLQPTVGIGITYRLIEF